MSNFDPTSRYYTVATATFTDVNGNIFTYVTRRFLPQGEKLALLAELPVSAGDRLDLLAHRTLGDPLQFWRVADANNALHPWDLMDEPGRTIRVAIPQLGPQL